MEIRRLDHVALLVKDVERSKRFYVQLLGMEEHPRPSNFNFPGAWLRKGSAEIHLIGEDEPGRVEQVYPGGYNPDELSTGHVTHFAFEVADLEETRLYFQSRGIPIVGGPRPRGDGVMQLYIRDPDGYIIEFYVWQK
ncbi:MAG TPA: VOC family protein [Ktedonobacteraceae bacterium]|nr:VOC family protein [Ktedonobacteraceae bacterium]